VLKNFCAEYPPGIHFLFAPNGSGKTTLLNILGGADRSYFGKVFLSDLNATADPEVANRSRSYLPAELRFYPGVSAYEFLSFIAQVREFDQKVFLKQSQEQFGITEEILKQSTENLSLGQKKRLFLAATLISQVPCWILDEPTNGLDQNYRGSLLRILKRGAAEGKTIVLASHDHAFADELEVKPIHCDFRDKLPK
jgi:ABC-2 type transport system ATP-binding protein